MRPPLVPEDILPSRLQAQAVRALVRSVISAAGTVDRTQSPEQYAKARWGTEVARNVDYVMRAATSPAITTQSGWAAEIAHVVMMFIASLRPVSAAADLLSRGLQLRFNGAAGISLPTISQQPAGFVGESKPIPVVQFTSASGVTLQPRKLALITVLSHELMASSNAEAIVRQCLIEAGVLGLDAALLSASAGTADAPAGLLNGVAALPASSATPPSDAMVSDLAALGGAVARVAGTNICFVMAPEQALAAHLYAPMLSYPVLASKALPAKTVIALASDALVSAFDPAPMIDVSRDMAAVMSDAPGDIVSAGGVVGAPVASVFQTDKIALRMRLPCAWAVRASNAIAWMSATTW